MSAMHASGLSAAGHHRAGDRGVLFTVNGAFSGAGAAEVEIVVARIAEGPAAITKADRADRVGGAEPHLGGEGIGEVLALLASSVGELPNRRGAPHLARSKEQLEKLLARLRVAHAIALNDDGAELVALELRHALDALGEIAGTISSDDLLGRIFSRFCIGK